jgi:hypothetical protein
MLKNKDGTPFRLNAPNKLAKNQKIWDKKKIILHNFEWKTATQSDESLLTKVKLELAGLPKPTKQPDSEPKLDLVPPVVIPPQNQPTKPPPTKTLKNLVHFHCLPAKVVVFHDKVYNEDIRRLRYGEKFIFPGIVVNTNDIIFQFWSNDPNKQITEQSIVYPFRYENGVPYDEYRWWRVTEIQDKNNGYLFSAIPSDTQPDFSD